MKATLPICEQKDLIQILATNGLDPIPIIKLGTDRIKSKLQYLI